MAIKAKFQAIRGTRDLLPPETALWTRVEQTAHEVFRTFGFGEIRTPIIEPIELIRRSIGSSTDIVSKEMFLLRDPVLVSLEPSEVRWHLEILGKYIREEDSARNWNSAKAIDVREYACEYGRALEQAKKEGAVLEDQAVSNLLALIQETQETSTVLEFDTEGLLKEKWSSYLAGLRKLTKEIVLLPEVLRPEATASVCRAYIEHNMQQLPQPVKLYYMGPMFRRERPQKGRYRQFYQIGAEVLGGTDAPAIDAEVIEMVMTFFDRLGLEGAELSINSIGHAADNCRRGYVETLRAELTKVKDNLGADSQRRIDTNPLRVLDSKLEHEQPIIAGLPKIADHLCDDCKAHYTAVKRELDLRNVKYDENWRLVRGLDYYMRTTFEITARGLGSQNAICGGGRYDGLVELLGGPPTKGIGFAIGEDRLILSLQEAGKGSAAEGRDVYIAWLGANAYATAIRAAKNLRAAGVSVELPPTEQKFGKALERASKLGSRFALILGDNEVSSGEWTLKNLATGDQTKIAESHLPAHLKGHQ